MKVSVDYNIVVSKLTLYIGGLLKVHRRAQMVGKSYVDAKVTTMGKSKTCTVAKMTQDHGKLDAKLI